MEKITITQLKEKIDQIEAEIEDLEHSKRVLENYQNQLIYPELDMPDWSVEAGNVLKR